MNPMMSTIDAASALGVSLSAVHKAFKNKKLLFTKVRNRAYFGHDIARSFFEFSFKKQVIAAQIVKGGTGKTSIIHNLAVRANLYGARVLCIDVDQQGNLTEAFGVNAEKHPCMIDVLQGDSNLQQAIINVAPGLDLLPSRLENAVLDNLIMLKKLPIDRVYASRIEQLRKKYDLILLDCPPALGQSVAAVALAVDTVIAPVTPERFSISGLRITKDEFETLEQNFEKTIPVKVLINKFDNRTALSHEVMALLVRDDRFGPLLFKSHIRSSQDFPNAAAKGVSIFDTFTDSSAKEDVDLVTQELLEIGQFSKTSQRPLVL